MYEYKGMAEDLSLCIHSIRLRLDIFDIRHRKMKTFVVAIIVLVLQQHVDLSHAGKDLFRPNLTERHLFFYVSSSLCQQSVQSCCWLL